MWCGFYVVWDFFLLIGCVWRENRDVEHFLSLSLSLSLLASISTHDACRIRSNQPFISSISTSYFFFLSYLLLPFIVKFQNVPFQRWNCLWTWNWNISFFPLFSFHREYFRCRKLQAKKEEKNITDFRIFYVFVFVLFHVLCLRAWIT